MIPKVRFPSLIFLLSTLTSHLPSSSGLFTTKQELKVLRTPDSAFSNLAAVGYPWSPKYTTYSYGKFKKLRLHYIDEGPASPTETLLLLHGTPAWSFLFREMLPLLIDAGYRVVVPDFIGTGRSDKLAKLQDYTHQLHVDAVVHIIDTLKLKDVTFIGHDLGGPIGSSALVARPNAFKRLVYLNTWLPQGDVFASVKRFIDHIPYFGVRLLTKTLGYFQPIAAIFLATSDVTIPEVLDGYKAPYPDPRYQGGIAAWPLMIPLSPTDIMATEMRKVVAFVKDQPWSGPVMIGYSEKERITIAGRDFIEGVFPSSCKVMIPRAGHYLMEDEGPLISRTIIEFIGGNCLPNGAP